MDDVITRRPPRRRWFAVLLVVTAVAVVAVVFAMLGLAGVRHRAEQPGASGSPSAGESPTATTTASPTSSVGSAVGASPSASGYPSTQQGTGPGLTARQRAGQRIIYSYPGLTPPASLLQHIRDGEAAGVIFFSENISSITQIAGVIAQLRQAQRESPVHVPLLLMTDQEGGTVRRLPGQPVLSEKEIGQSANPPAQAREAGSGAAATLAGVGMNVNLAPVLDVYYAPGDAIDRYGRSYSSDANTVATLGADFITAQQAAGIAAAAKHFPGLGSMAAGQNTDTGPVAVTVSLAGLRTRDEVPYPAAITNGVKLIMVSWAVYPALDPTAPAGLSRTVVQSELRGRLHYTGVTITDALEAGALTAYGPPARRAVLAAQAGMDLILCSARDVTQGESVTAGLADALAAGQLDPAGFTAALNRIDALRASLR
jgi:beta-N-acetylhexosaminidase